MGNIEKQGKAGKDKNECIFHKDKVMKMRLTKK
jgi:hypothetical protein